MGAINDTLEVLGFQFHKVRLKAYFNNGSAKDCNKFQFHKVRLKGDYNS